MGLFTDSFIYPRIRIVRIRELCEWNEQKIQQLR